MTGFREQGSGIPLMLLHGISSGAASWHKQMALNGFRVLAWDMPGYGESPMLAVARANAGITPTRWRPCWIAPVSGRQCWSAIPQGRWWPAPLRQSSRIASFIWCWPTRRRGTAMPRRSSGSRSGATESSRWRWGRNPRPDPRPEAAAPRRARGRYRHRRGGHAGAAPGRLPCRLVDAGA